MSEEFLEDLKEGKTETLQKIALTRDIIYKNIYRTLKYFKFLKIRFIMGISYEHSILPLSDLRTDLDKVKNQLRKTPVIITTNGRPDFGVCDLETLAIATQIKDLRDLLKKRMHQSVLSEDATSVFKKLNKKHGA